MNSDLQILVKECRNLKQFLPVLSELEKYLATLDSSKIKEVADAAYIFRECSDAIDTIRKNLDALSAKCQEQVHTYCLMYQEKSVKTDICTLTPRSTIVYKYPTKAKDEGWDTFMQKVLQDTNTAIQNELVRPHWPGMVNYMTKYLQEHYTLPFDIQADKFQDAELKCTIRGKSEVL